MIIVWFPIPTEKSKLQTYYKCTGIVLMVHVTCVMRSIDILKNEQGIDYLPIGPERFPVSSLNPKLPDIVRLFDLVVLSF